MAEIFTFKMPDIGEGVVEGEVISWLKKEGDALAKDEPVVTMMTDKATVELPTPYPGVLKKTYYPIGAIAKKGLPLFDVEVEGAMHKAAETLQAQKPQETYVKPTQAESRPSGKGLAAPPVRKLARDLGISLESIQGTGPAGRILKEDLQSHKGTSATHLEGDTEVPIVGIKNLMAKKMSASHAEIPSFSLFGSADATRLLHLQEKMLREAVLKGFPMTITPFFIKALSLTLKKHPEANASIDTEKNTLILHTKHNIGIAMSTPLGLIVPVLKGVENMNLTQVIEAYTDLKARAQSNQLTSSDMKEATITLSNFGALSGGSTHATPIINPPEVAILAVAKIHKEPIVLHNTVGVHEMLPCSWSFDHRVIDGNLATAISQTFVQYIEQPEDL